MSTAATGQAPGPRVVVLDDEANMGKVLAKLLGHHGFSVQAFTSARAAQQHLDREGAAVLLTDLRMPEMTGEEMLAWVGEHRPGTQVILMTAYGTVESAMNCVRSGAFDYITKPFDTAALVETVRRAARVAGAGDSPAAAPPAAADTQARAGSATQELLGQSEALRTVRELIARLAPTDSPVIIYGESGTGKELAARALHRLSPRTSHPFVAINCASIPENLMESELFGHEKGAFTGATERKQGLMEAAEGGTLFLDEVGELPLGLQAKLLRALQESEITPVGSVRSIKVNIRVVAATNRQLEEEVKQGSFREDLFYRLNVLRVKMPPLRARREDIAVLAQHFLEHFRQRNNMPALQISGNVMARLGTLDWPGNVRELRNCMERLVILSDGKLITESLLNQIATSDSGFRRAISANPDRVPPGEEAARPGAEEGTPEQIVELREARDQFEADYLRSVLRASGGNVSEAAKLAGISRRSFYEKLEKLGIDPGAYKA